MDVVLKVVYHKPHVCSIEEFCSAAQCSSGDDLSVHNSSCNFPVGGDKIMAEVAGILWCLAYKTAVCKWIIVCSRTECPCGIEECVETSSGQNGSKCTPDSD